MIVHLLDHYGNYAGAITPAEDMVSVTVLRPQVRLTDDPSVQAEVARELVHAAAQRSMGGWRYAYNVASGSRRPERGHLGSRSLPSLLVLPRMSPPGRTEQRRMVLRGRDGTLKMIFGSSFWEEVEVEP